MKIKNLCKSYDGKKVLDNFSAEFMQGGVYSIMGRSGCGKTTLLNIITGLVSADSGEIIAEQNKRISVVFQEDRLCEKLSSVVNVRIVCDSKTDIKSIESNLEAVGLTADDIKKPASELSGGMKRRTAIVRAVMAQSSMIILDEPFKGLDTATRQKTISYILENTNGRTLIVITHDTDETALLGGEVVKMNTPINAEQ